MKVFVCGGRDFTDMNFLAAVLDNYRDAISVLVRGDAKGADRMAGQWANANGVPVRTHPADWNRYGRGAGPIRNMQMLHEERPELVIAFPGGSGTSHMVRIAKQAGVKVIEVAP